MKRLFHIFAVNMQGKRFIFVFLALAWLLSASFVFPSLDLDLKTVVIDAGHGGKDPGCVGATSYEKHIALGIALKLGKYIEDHYKDVKVVYTRKTDVFVELHERANIANKAKADLFICIHANAGAAGAYGCETYVMGLHKNNANLNVAKRENASILLEDDHETKYEGFNPNSDESYIIFNLMQSAHLDQSLSFADKVQRQFKSIGRADRGVKQAGFLVLWRTSMPSVLIEAGFLSNKEEEKFLNSEKNQTKMASSIYKAFTEYKKEVDNKLSVKKGSSQNVVKDKKSVKISDKNAGQTIISGSKNRETASISLKVQITSSLKQIPLIAANFNGIENVREYQSNGIYKYTTGEVKTMHEASDLQKMARSKGFRDAFVVAFEGDKRIPLDEALQKLKAKK